MWCPVMQRKRAKFQVPQDGKELIVQKVIILLSAKPYSSSFSHSKHGLHKRAQSLCTFNILFEVKAERAREREIFPCKTEERGMVWNI
jgi:hypothetical protein